MIISKYTAIKLVNSVRLRQHSILDILDTVYPFTLYGIQEQNLMNLNCLPPRRFKFESRIQILPLSLI